MMLPPDSNRAAAPLLAQITVQLADPFGGVHPVEFDACKNNIVDHRIRGVFADAVEYPPDSPTVSISTPTSVTGCSSGFVTSRR